MSLNTDSENNPSRVVSKKRHCVKNIFLPILLLVIGNLYTYHSIITNHYPSFFYQNEFSPAVMFACDAGFANPGKENIALKEFLDNKTTSFTCDNVVKNSLAPLNNFQKFERYLLLSAGFTWKIFGIAWDNLIPLFLLLYSISLLAIYYIFRLGMNRFFSFIFSLFLATSSLQLFYVTQLRDYSVAPFLLMLLLIAGKLVVSSPGRKCLFLLSLLGGGILGIGLGFRVDLLILIPFFLITLIFFVKTDKRPIQNKLFAILFFLTGFLIAGFPILNAMHALGGGDLAHVIILGLADPFTTSLGLAQPETYSIIPAYRDLIPYTVVNSFAQRVYGVEKLFPTATATYSHYGNLFLLKYIATFPADFLIRMYASIIQVPLIVAHGDIHNVSPYFPLKYILLLIPVIATFFVAIFQLRTALFLLFSLIYLGAYPVLQFDPRHYFYLEFIGWLFIGILSQQIMSLIINRNNAEFFENIKMQWTLRAKMIFLIILVCGTILSVALIASRYYQSNNLSKLFGDYLGAQAATVSPVLNEKSDKFVVKLPSKKHPPQTSYLETIYLKIETRENCLLNNISLHLHYLEEPPAFWEAPKVLTVPTANQTTLFLPIYNYHNGAGKTVIDETYLPSYRVGHLEYTLQDASCIQSIAYVKETEAMPLLLALTLQTGWENTKRYQFLQGL